MIGDRLRHARELNGLTQSELAEKVAVTQPTIAMMERDGFIPSSDLLQRLSTALGFPSEYFSTPTRHSFPMGSLLFRKYSRLRAADRDRAYRIARETFEISEALRLEVRKIPVNLPRVSDDTPERAAGLTRSALGFEPSSPIGKLVRRLERNGVRVFVLTDEFPDLDAFSIWVDDIPVIVLNAGRPGDRQRWNVAHELGHLVLHRGHDAKQDDIETEANRFAAEFLTPRSAIQNELVAPVTLTLLSQLKSRWGVSMKSLITRAKELGVVTPRQHRYLQMQLSHRWGKNEPVEIPVEKPRALRKAAELLYGTSPNVARIAKDYGRSPIWIARILDVHAAADESVAAPNDSDSARVVPFSSRSDK